MKEVFKAKDICKILDISGSRYEFLKNKFQITPDMSNIKGSGQNHKYSFDGVYKFGISDFLHLRKYRVKIIKSVLKLEEKSDNMNVFANNLKLRIIDLY